MKKERLSFLILFVEIAAIVFLHSAKNRQSASEKALYGAKKAATTNTLTLTKIK
ncbi:hypothetical protein [Longitalea luteola]|uniref:hypothetical protein n=1 Tax=Longitalea luteola TaxID=2812563 RepID=UPI001A96B5A0|nr:hypothetical protein [Longitalea luteola]